MFGGQPRARRREELFYLNLPAVIVMLQHPVWNVPCMLPTPSTQRLPTAWRCRFLARLGQDGSFIAEHPTHWLISIAGNT